MDKRLRRKLDPFMRIQQRAARFCMSQKTAHEQAIAEDVQRFGKRLTPLLPLLDQRNKI